MKKKIVVIAGSLAFMANAGVGFTSFGQADSEYSSLIKANIEALAVTETYENYFKNPGLCSECGAEIDICFPCAEWDCGSCTIEIHEC